MPDRLLPLALVAEMQAAAAANVTSTPELTATSRTLFRDWPAEELRLGLSLNL